MHIDVIYDRARLLCGYIEMFMWWNGTCIHEAFSAANLALAGFPLTNALGESMPSGH